MADHKSFWFYARVLLVGCVALSVTDALAAVIRPVATSDQQVPGLSGLNFAFPPGNGLYLQGRALSINEEGQVAFWSYISDGRHGVFTEAGPTGLTTLAVVGDRPFGAPADSSYETFNHHVLLTDQGKTAYSGAFQQTTQPIIGGYGAVYEFSPDGTTRLVARTGGSSPGQPTDRILPFDSVSFTAGNEDGDILFYAQKNAQVVASLIDDANTGLRPLVPPASQDQFLDFYGIQLNEQGQTLFTAEHPGGTPAPDGELESNTGVWIEDSATLRQIGRSPADGYRVTPLGINGSGQVVYAGDIEFNPVLRRVDIDGTSVDLAHGDVGAVLPGATFFSFQSAAIDQQGSVVFTAGIFENGQLNDAVFRFDSATNQLTPLLIGGETVPGYESLGTIIGAGASYFLDSDGDLAIQVVTLSDGGIEGISDFFYDLDGNQFTKIVGTGDMIEVAPGQFRVISHMGFSGSATTNHNGLASRLNDRGDYVFDVRFTDGSGGIFVATVPEPSTLVLGLLAIAAFGTRCAVDRGFKRTG